VAVARKILTLCYYGLRDREIRFARRRNMPLVVTSRPEGVPPELGVAADRAWRTRAE
jgi:hypothetical protein